LSKLNQDRIARDLTGAFVASVVLSILFTEFGYSGGATMKDFIRELVLSLVSFCLPALVVSRAFSPKRFLIEIGLISVSGALINFIFKVTVLEGSNGLPAYVVSSTRTNSWKPYLDLLSDWLISAAIVSIIALPLLAIGSWIWTFMSKTFSATSR
jgi:hypothetical protein